MRKMYNGKVRKCAVQNKTIFPDESTTRKALMRAWGHDPNMNIKDMHVYECPHCKGFHFGHISYYQKFLEKQNVIDVVSKTSE